MNRQTPLSAEQIFALLPQQQALQTEFARIKLHPRSYLNRLTGCAFAVMSAKLDSHRNPV